MKKVFLILSLLSFGCSFPIQITIGEPTPTPEPTLAPTPTPQIRGELGTESNPLILTLAPSSRPTDSVISAGDVISAYIQSRTGYRIVTVIPVSENALLDSISKGNAHIASLSPYGYAIAYQRSDVTALLARVRDGQIFYGAQIIANRTKNFTPYFDEIKNENTTDVASALKQFQEKKACWSDPVSPSGYVIPLGLLKQAGVQIRSDAFLANQPSVVRAVYADDICDFGATFIDARTSPTLEADYPDVMDKVKVIWRTPNIIPYENIVMSTDLPFEMRRVIQRAFIDLMLTPEGKSAMQTVYGFDETQVIEDSAYTEFVTLATASGLDLLSLIE
ncbi:MAG: phosphate/phosphite/phosphonate ABC transporter substrate-binding protein [Anaerolineales bacterium]|nr:phosphate/phosphite/phosphonate ABC transporter substrate-binding protein [Anaerolineales bacterium]